MARIFFVCFAPKSPKGDFGWLIISLFICSRFKVTRHWLRRIFDFRAKRRICVNRRQQTTSDEPNKTPPARSDILPWDGGHQRDVSTALCSAQHDSDSWGGGVLQRRFDCAQRDVTPWGCGEDDKNSTSRHTQNGNCHAVKTASPPRIGGGKKHGEEPTRLRLRGVTLFL